MAEEKLTPLMEQYFNIRAQYPEALLMFQVGDFYELFFDDAKAASAYLAIALTKRGKCKGKDVPLCGVPVHALNHYLTKLVRGGFKVAICDQVSEPRPGTVVKREVTRVFTPGTLTDSHMLDDRAASYLLSFYPSKKEWILIFSELLTAQIFITTVPAGSYRLLEAELSRFFPDEIVVPKIKGSAQFTTYFKKNGYWVSESEDSISSSGWINKQFNASVLDKVKQESVIQEALELFYSYLFKTQNASLEQFKIIQFYQTEDYLYLDSSTQRNLEIIKNNQDGNRNNTLLSIVDRSKTSMGSRLVRKWLTRPLLQEVAILQRQEVVASFKGDIELMQKLKELLSGISDIERVVGRIALKKAPIPDYIALKQSLRIIPSIRDQISQKSDLILIKTIVDKFVDFSSLVDLLENSLDYTNSDYVIKTGFDSRLDRLRELVENSQKALLALEAKEVQKTGIGSLKIRFNKLSGYVIEVTNTHKDKVPERYKRLQSLTNKERFVTPELLELQNEISKARNEIGAVENEILQSIKDAVYSQLSYLRHLAYALAYLDGLYGFAVIAYEQDYVAPKFNDEGIIKIEGGRHPVVETKLDEKFIPNNTRLNEASSLWVITGPNMGGKSTYLRQVALINILAQCGSLVPAMSAFLPLVDRIFTRIGSGDNLVEGKSTFLVEMEETAIICSQATKKSLVILDEVGRGTSTFDGLAIAQAVIEYIYEHVQAKCLFATHYHELTKLKDKFSGICNYHMLCEKTKDGIVFLHKIEEGISEGSFGIDVAMLADMPAKVVNRARDILYLLEQDSKNNKSTLNKVSVDVGLKDKVVALQRDLAKREQMSRILRELNLEEVSAKQSLDILWKLKSEC